MKFLCGIHCTEHAILLCITRSIAYIDLLFICVLLFNLRLVTGVRHSPA
jgi:hypothetical protein